MALRLAFGHKSRSGKDTAGETVGKLFPETVKVSFAEPLYAISYAVQDILGIERHKDATLLQLIGSSFRRHYGEGVWCDALEKKIEAIPIDVPIIVTDMRYKNEFEMLGKNGFTRVKINRPDRPIDRDPGHESEIDLDDTKFDCVINNTGTLDDLEDSVKWLISGIEVTTSSAITDDDDALSVGELTRSMCPKDTCMDFLAGSTKLPFGGPLAVPCAFKNC